jgi:Arc/MetJ-type ribon-helix-helix transcriptional regulator
MARPAGRAAPPGGDIQSAAAEYDKCMKRITVSLPDELAEQVKRAAGGERRVSSYVVAALEDYAEREDLKAVLASWNEQTPVPEDIRRQVQDELDRAGLTGRHGRDGRLAG